MTLCCECGAGMAPDENFCGSCGARQQRDDSSVVADRSPASDEVEAITEDHIELVTDYSEKLAADGSTWAAGARSDHGSGTGEIAPSDEL